MHVHVITSPGETLDPRHVLSLLIACWRESGHRVTVGPVRRLEADLGIMHVDRTWVAREWVPDNPGRYPLLNAGVLDISKRRISRQLLRRDSDYAGPVIIKTDANCFGNRERARDSRWRLQALRYRLARRGYWRWMRQLPPGDYPVYDNLQTVPAWIWRRAGLVAERFLPEIENGEYVLRVWMFIGAREYGVRLFSRHPVVKAGRITRHEYIHEVPQQLRDIRAQLGIDYGKFDYVMVGGEPILLDANKTPVAVSTSRSENVRNLALALDDYLCRPGAA